MQITFLGTGTSHGIPVIGCHCSVCQSKDPRDKRNRTAVLVQVNRVNIVIDAPPELRLQLLAADCGHVAAMLLTHAHADHVSGLDDVRIFSEKAERKFPIYGPAPALRQLQERFAYVFRKTQEGGGKPRLELHPISRRFSCAGVEVVPVPLWHGRIRVFGYRIKNFAYCTDVSSIPAASYSLLQGLEVLVLDALRPLPHQTHFHLEQALGEAKRIGAKKTYFTHMCHLLGHRATEKLLPPRMHLAYDGLRVRMTAGGIS